MNPIDFPSKQALTWHISFFIIPIDTPLGLKNLKFKALQIALHFAKFYMSTTHLDKGITTSVELLLSFQGENCFSLLGSSNQLNTSSTSFSGIPNITVALKYALASDNRVIKWYVKYKQGITISFPQNMIKIRNYAKNSENVW